MSNDENTKIVEACIDALRGQGLWHDQHTWENMSNSRLLEAYEQGGLAQVLKEGKNHRALRDSQQQRRKVWSDFINPAIEAMTCECGELYSEKLCEKQYVSGWETSDAYMNEYGDIETGDIRDSDTTDYETDSRYCSSCDRNLSDAFYQIQDWIQLYSGKFIEKAEMPDYEDLDDDDKQNEFIENMKDWDSIRKEVQAYKDIVGDTKQVSVPGELELKKLNLKHKFDSIKKGW